jgi:hypothetical protein
MAELRVGLSQGVDVSLFADPRFSANQMFAIRICLYDGVDVSKYADPSIPWEKMIDIRKSLLEDQQDE